MIKKTEKEIMKNWEGDPYNPIVSICCTTYNHQNYIAEALDSFLMQETNFVFEIIVRDDASTDKTAHIIREYEKNYPNIIKPIYEKENGYQKGIRPMPVTFTKAKGKYIALCEGDDYWTSSQKLALQIKFLEKNIDYAGIAHQCSIIDENGKIKRMFYRRNIKEVLRSADFLSEPPFQTATFMFRTSYLEKYPLSHKFYSGDKFLFSFISIFGKVKYNSQVLSCYRQHEQGISHGVDYQKFVDDIHIPYILYSIDKKYPKYKHLAYIHLSMLILTKNIRYWSSIKHGVLATLYSFSYVPKNYAFLKSVFYHLLLRTKCHILQD
ncbi:glycosyltransferase [Sulfurimonas microaerophilic]|uniref:glycosyltransferase n=1 Tax=Sulfurimonas microaerophilic TaxID=3058392 RepID=UPI0027154E58|nr:glycosyltransferase [Sulfurimonas sp. hsl 1-7]